MKVIDTNLPQSALEESLALKVPAEIIGQPEGVTPLDIDTKIPVDFLPGTNTFGSFFYQYPSTQTIPLFTATTAFTINNLRGLKTSAGTLSISIQIDGVNVAGLSSISVNSTLQNLTATANNTGSVGARVTLVISSISSGVNLEGTLGVTLG